MPDTDVLRWAWLGAGVALLVAEISTASLVALPFAIGAFVAAAMAFAGLGLPVQLAACAVAAGGSYAALRPLARRMHERGDAAGIGSRRLVNEAGTVLSEIPTGDVGLIRIGSEEWRAESYDGGAIEQGARVRVLDTKGTRVVVAPFEAPVPEELLPE